MLDCNVDPDPYLCKHARCECNSTSGGSASLPPQLQPRAASSWRTSGQAPTQGRSTRFLTSGLLLFQPAQDCSSDNGSCEYACLAAAPFLPNTPLSPRTGSRPEYVHAGDGLIECGRCTLRELRTTSLGTPQNTLGHYLSDFGNERCCQWTIEHRYGPLRF
jgi:hypothetical protein